ncbi:MAG: LamG domain-containing protein, partial [Candidatus Paceibacterota bacterium]
NSTSTGLYYTYVNGSWELTALFETTNYQTKYATSDNGTSTVLFEVGNHLKITPDAIASRTNTTGGGEGSSYTLTFNTNPTYSGSVTFDGTSYTNSQTVSKSSGSYNISGTPGSGRSFSYWSPTGMTVTDTSTLSTSATVSGTGSLSMIQVPDFYTKLLLHMDGTNGSTVITDSSANPKTVTVSGTHAALDTTYVEFGTASFYATSLDSVCSTSYSSDLDFGTGDFTVDFWVYRGGAVAQYYTLFQSNSQGGYGLNWWATTGTMYWRDIQSDNTHQIITSVLPSDSWVHVAVVRYGNTITVYFNGTSVGSGDFTGRPVNLNNVAMNISVQNTNTVWMDEFRVSKGIARWTSNFTPPTAPY